MHDGAIGPILEVASGFHVFRLVERQHAGLQPFGEKTQALVRKKLTNVSMERTYKRIVNEMKRRAVIQILDSDW
jgi:hypothetical protein